MSNINGNAGHSPGQMSHTQQAMPSAQEMRQNIPNAQNDVSQSNQNYGMPQAYDNDANIMQRMQLIQQQQMAAMRTNPMLAMYMMQQNPMMAMAATSQSNPVVQRDQMQHLQANQNALYSQLIRTGNPIALQMLSQGYNPAVVLSIMSNPNLNQLGSDAFSESRAAQGPVAVAAQKPGKTMPKEARRKKNKPKRPLSAYNFFFREERARIIKEEGAEDEEKKNVESKPEEKTERVEDDGDGGDVAQNHDRVYEKKDKENEGSAASDPADAGEEVATKDAVKDETAKDGTKGAVEDAAAVKSDGDDENSAKKEGSEAKSDDSKPVKDGDGDKQSSRVKYQAKFENLAKTIGERWRAIDKEGDEFKRYKKMADDDLERYKKQLDALNTVEIRDANVGPVTKKKKTQQDS